MEILSSYGIIISASVIIIISYLFNLVSNRINIPSVLLLILLGIGINQALRFAGTEPANLFPVLEILGIVGLIMIVLEAALDLKLTRKKLPLIWKSGLISLLSLAINAVLIALIINVYVDSDFYNSLIYAIPLSIISSAIVLPSVSSLSEHKKEFLIYESTFSDIFGIMIFYFLIQNAEAESVAEVSTNIVVNIGLTLVVSILASYLLVWLFQQIRTQVKLFLLIAVLVLLYAIGKSMHLSSLIMILIFGLILENRHFFFKGKLSFLLREEIVGSILKDFKMITAETAFIVRTFFFVIFGITITLSSLYDIKVITVSLIILAVIFGIRYLIFKLFFKKDILPETFISPRGLITILLFFDIPEEFQIEEFNSGILLFVIMFTSLIMAFALIKSNRKAKEPEFEIDNRNNDESIKENLTE